MKKTVPVESFFNFFDPPKAPGADEDAESDDVEVRLELDYQLGEDIKEKLIPRAIDWFTGEALQFEELDEDLEEGDFEDEDDEEDDELSEERDDDEESDEEVTVLRLVKDHINGKLITQTGRQFEAQARGCWMQTKLGSDLCPRSNILEI